MSYFRGPQSQNAQIVLVDVKDANCLTAVPPLGPDKSRCLGCVTSWWWWWVEGEGWYRPDHPSERAQISLKAFFGHAPPECASPLRV